MKIFYIDLFSGAGGTTTGIHLAHKDIEVIACVNHDENAIKSHAANHPNCKHYVEDVRDLNVVRKLKILVDKTRAENPGCFINIWASLECTNYSKAKGGQPRDADSRTLAYALYAYMKLLNPDYLYIENVREFMAWGPLDDKGRPISMKNGRDYLAWVETIKGFGYWHDHRLMNAADFGAFTSRERYFGVFAKTGLPISWPKQTHSKNPDTMFDDYLKPWKAVKEVLDLDDEGTSIFGRKKPLVEATLKRIYAGLIKFVANGDETYLQKNYSGRPEGKVIPVNRPADTITTIDHHSLVRVKHFLKRYNGGNPEDKVSSVDAPVGVISTNNRHALVNLQYLQSYYGKGGVHSSEAPCPTLTTKDRLGKVTPQFFSNYYSNGGELSSVEEPCHTITGVPKQRLTTVNFIDQQYGKSKPVSANGPVGAITTNPKLNLINAKPWIMDTSFNNIGSSIDQPSRVITANHKQHYLINPSWFGYASSVEGPTPVIIARQDKSPLYLVESEYGMLGIVINEDDSPMMKKIKEFMAIYGLCDIKMRMLKIDELLRIQGFPEDYVLIGTKTEQKKYIGNAVVPLVAMEIANANLESLMGIIWVCPNPVNIGMSTYYERVN